MRKESGSYTIRGPVLSGISSQLPRNVYKEISDESPRHFFFGGTSSQLYAAVQDMMVETKKQRGRSRRGGKKPLDSLMRYLFSNIHVQRGLEFVVCELAYIGPIRQKANRVYEPAFPR